MAIILRKLLQSVTHPTPLPLVCYSWVSSVLPEPPVPPLRVPTELVRRVFQHGMANGYLIGNALGILDRFFQDCEHASWAQCWLEELTRVTASDEIQRGCELFIAAGHLDPEQCFITLAAALIPHVLGSGFEINCVSPRGLHFARLLVQVFMLSYSVFKAKENVAVSGGDQRAAKVQRLDRSNDVSDGSCCTDVAAVEQQLSSLYAELVQHCQEGELRPAVYFAASFLCAITEQALQSDSVRFMLEAMPQQLLSSVIRIDPKIIAPSTLLPLYDLSQKKQRDRALQSLCLLRQLKAI